MQINETLRRWLLFGGVLVLCGVLLFILPPQWAYMGLIVLVVGSLAVAVVAQSSAAQTRLQEIGRSVSQRFGQRIDQPSRPTARIPQQMPIPPALPASNSLAAIQAAPVSEQHLGWLSRVQWGSALTLVAGVALAYAGALQVYGDPQDYPVSGGFVMIIIGLAMIFIVLNGALPTIPALVESPATVQRLIIRPRWMLASVALIAFTALRAVIKPQEAYLGEQVLTWVLGMIAFVRAVAPREGRIPDSKPLLMREYVLLLVLFIGAMLVRGVNLGSEPPIYDQDEALFSQEGAIIWNEHFLATPFEPGIHSHPRTFQSMIGVSVALFGLTTEAARLPSALFGALLIPAIYLLGRELGGWRIGLMGALFVLPWSFAVQFSRLSFNQPIDLFFATLAFYYFLRGLRRGAATDYALCGLMLGLTQLFYLGGRITPFVLIGLVFWLWLRQREIIVRQWKLLLIVPAGALIVLFPHYHFLAYTGQPLTTRADKNIFLSGQWDEVVNSGQSVVGYVFEQVKHSFLALLWYNDLSTWYGYGSSILGPLGGPPFLVGVIVATLILWRRPKWALLPGWTLAAILLGSTLSISPPQYQRYVIGETPIGLLIALGVLAVAFGLMQTFRQGERFQNRVALVLAGLLAVGNFWYYVGVYIPANTYLNNRPNWATNLTAQEMVKAWQQGRQIILVPEFASGVEATVTVQYFMTGRRYIQFDGEGLTAVDHLLPITVIVGPSRKNDLDRIMTALPGGQLREVHLKFDNSLGFYVYERPGGLWKN